MGTVAVGDDEVVAGLDEFHHRLDRTAHVVELFVDGAALSFCNYRVTAERDDGEAIVADLLLLVHCQLSVAPARSRRQRILCGEPTTAQSDGRRST